MTDRSEPVVAEQTYKGVSLDKVWTAITDPIQMKQWFFEPMEDFEPKVDFETEFNVQFEGADYLHIWKILEVISQQKIVYDWRYGGVPGETTVTWELSESSDGTTLKLTHGGLDSFPDDPNFSREGTQAGWDYLVQQSLKAFLEGGSQGE
ncbi:MAG: SRPBCC domain-containing protein [Planctomycetes bacterium]|nr:SRPBCC domain-containing protein [Planctomycetota bacterium]